MAEGGGEFGYEDPDLDKQLDHDDDEREVNRTQPFQPFEPGGSKPSIYQPGAPYNEGEQTEMSTFHHEHSGLPDTSYAETSFFGEDEPLIQKDSDRKSVIDTLKRVFTGFKEIVLQL